LQQRFEVTFERVTADGLAFALAAPREAVIISMPLEQPIPYEEDKKMKTSQGDIQIYVACLASYNNGILHGAWINAEQDAYAIYDEVQTMLTASPVKDAEEWAIHDYEGFEGVRLPPTYIGGLLAVTR